MRALVRERGDLLARTITVQEEVRNRIARDLHDELGQFQTAVLLGLRSVSSATSLEQARERVDAIHEIAVAAIESTRRMARGLSPSVLSDFGLTQAIDRVCEDLTTATGLNITRDLQIGPARFTPAVEIATYRIVQEGLTNAAKHSGASAVHVHLSHSASTLQITITDNGGGIRQAHTASAGLGLIGMRERMVMLGGSFTITSPRIGGTTIHASVPAPLVQS
jgi:two-component system sensor histidine kinase UhpB